MLHLAGVTAGDTLYDLGCGDGRIVIAAARMFGARGVGVDIDPQRIKEADENAEYAGVADRVEFRRLDLKDVALGDATVVTLYLLESVNVGIRAKLFRELAPGTRVVSHAFGMGEWECDHKLTHPKARADTIYAWRIPARAGGTWTWTDGQTSYSLRLRQSFQNLGGRLDAGRLGTYRVREGSLAGHNLAVALTMIDGGGAVDLTLRGVVSGDVVEGTQEWRGGPRTGTRPWKAVRTPASLAGDWRLTMQKPDPKLDGTLGLRGTPGARTARYARDEDPVPTEPAAFYDWGASIRFEVPVDDATYVFTGFFTSEAASGKTTKGRSLKVRPWSARRLGR
jgi:hypothetical protein